ATTERVAIMVLQAMTVMVMEARGAATLTMVVLPGTKARAKRMTITTMPQMQPGTLPKTTQIQRGMRQKLLQMQPETPPELRRMQPETPQKLLA
ncbi:hypothetical protein, partial [Pseudomonas sp. FW215-R3]